ncbi:hypothetical protein CI102_11938 [Trichoderma harzianum]|nr:hypothetical protein CI102_11938 [Trichoderma harzianum]
MVAVTKGGLCVGLGVEVRVGATGSVFLLAFGDFMLMLRDEDGYLLRYKSTRACGRREEDVTVICWAESFLPLGHERQYAWMDEKGSKLSDTISNVTRSTSLAYEVTGVHRIVAEVGSRTRGARNILVVPEILLLEHYRFKC